MIFKKKTNYKDMDRSVNWVKQNSADTIGRTERRHNFFFWQRKNRYDKMKRNELAQKKAARCKHIIEMGA